MWPFFRKIKDNVSNHKKLSKYSNDELMEFIKNNETTDSNVLACICSEILRRQHMHYFISKSMDKIEKE